MKNLEEYQAEKEALELKKREIMKLVEVRNDIRLLKQDIAKQQTLSSELDK